MSQIDQKSVDETERSVSAPSEVAASPEIPPEALTEPLAGVVDSDNFTPRLLALLSNSLVWRESRAMRARFGLGTNHWRVISALAAMPGANSSEVSDFLAMNKAIVSKSVSVLTDSALVVQAEGAGRSRPLYLTRAGAEMHDEMLPISVRGQEAILAGMSRQEIDGLNTLLRTMLDRARDLQAGDAGDPLDDSEPPGSV